MIILISEFLLHLTDIITNHLLCTWADLGLLMKSCIDQGQLVPDDVISRLILSSLRGIEQTSWLLDGTTLTPLKLVFFKHIVDELCGLFKVAPQHTSVSLQGFLVPWLRPRLWTPCVMWTLL